MLWYAKSSQTHLYSAAKLPEKTCEKLSDGKTIGIGIVGAGFARTTQIPGFLKCDGARVVAITSRHREHAESVAKEFGIENVANDWRELIERDDIDLVSIVTPPATHMEITMAALERRKAVLCEKPMAMNADEAKRMTERAHEAGVLALIDHELRFLSSRRKMRAMLHEASSATCVTAIMFFVPIIAGSWEHGIGGQT